VSGTPLVLDLEASGFGRDSYPIEVGYVLPDGASFCTLIRPEPGWAHWDASAQSVHGIARDTAIRHGRAAADVARLLNERLRGMTAYTDGWAHDYSWLAALFEVAGLRVAFRLENLRSLLHDQDASRWHEVKQQVAGEMGVQRHRASADARLLQATVMRLRSLRA
jgi:hypothetical protein